MVTECLSGNEEGRTAALGNFGRTAFPGDYGRTAAEVVSTTSEVIVHTVCFRADREEVAYSAVSSGKGLNLIAENSRTASEAGTAIGQFASRELVAVKEYLPDGIIANWRELRLIIIHLPRCRHLQTR